MSLVRMRAIRRKGVGVVLFPRRLRLNKTMVRKTIAGIRHPNYNNYFVEKDERPTALLRNACADLL